MTKIRDVNYSGFDTQIHTPDNPGGLCFVISGENMPPTDPFIQGIRQAAEDKRLVTITPDLTSVGRYFGGAPNPASGPDQPDETMCVHHNFSEALDSAIQGYFADEANDFKPERFEVLAHSIGAAAALSAPTRHSNISQITALDPIPTEGAFLQNTTCPVHIILSEYPSFRRAGKRISGHLKDHNPDNTLDLVATTADKATAHQFRNNMDDVTDLVKKYTPLSGSAAPSIGPAPPDNEQSDPFPGL